MEPTLDYPKYGTIETVKIIDKDTFYQGSKTLSKRTHTIDYRTKDTTIARIGEIVQELRDDPSKLDVGFDVVESKSGRDKGYFVLRVRYSEVVR